MISCKNIHEKIWKLKRYSFKDYNIEDYIGRRHLPFDEKYLPLNGVYFLFENGEKSHGGDRIVRVGSHTGQGNLIKRLKEHFITENKDRSIFRKNIGRALLRKSEDHFLHIWNKDFTSKKARKLTLSIEEQKKQTDIERDVSVYLWKNFSFSILEVDNVRDRLSLEKNIIKTISSCSCNASEMWLGRFSPEETIRNSSLWLKQHVLIQQANFNFDMQLFERYFTHAAREI